MSATVPSSPAVGRTSGAVDRRVAIVQAQARRSLWQAAAFVVSAALAAATGAGDGSWLALHLFLAGGLLSAISGAAQLFAVTWAAGPAPSDRAALAQRTLLAVGVVAISTGRELQWPVAVPAAGGILVIAAVALLGVLLVREVHGGIQRRFDPALRWYLTALAAGTAGATLGVLRVVGVGTGLSGRLRSAHMLLNLLGLIGLSIAGTLPFFTATEARVKMSPRATSGRQTALLCAMGGSLLLAGAGLLSGNDPTAAAGLAAYAAGLAAVATVLPPLGRKQLRWAGARLAHLAAGAAWWLAAVCAATVRVARGDEPFSATVVGVLVVGGFAQILVGAVAYLGPVLRAGGHRRLVGGFALTRSWLGLVAANVAAVAVTVGAAGVAGAAVAAWVADAVVRGVLLAQPSPGLDPAGSASPG